MEQLTEDAVAARKEGLTYGQYIAKYRPPLLSDADSAVSSFIPLIFRM